MDKLFWAAIVFGVIFLLLACLYWFVPAGSLPTFLPGFIDDSPQVNLKHGIVAFVLAVVLLGFADYARPIQSSSIVRVGTVLSDRRRLGLHLFLVGFLVLFLELACIRWFAAYVVFLQFFTNVALIASFLGMSCGCLAARSNRDWPGYFPFLALTAVVAALCLYYAYHRWRWNDLAIYVGYQGSPQEVFFGTEYRNPDVARFAVPIELVATVFFILIALMFVSLGQVLGRSLLAYPHRVAGYSLNIGGGLAGIISFSALAMLQVPPPIWFLVIVFGVGYLLYQLGGLTLPRVLALAALPLVLVVPTIVAQRVDL